MEIYKRIHFSQTYQLSRFGCETQFVTIKVMIHTINRASSIKQAVRARALDFEFADNAPNSTNEHVLVLATCMLVPWLNVRKSDCCLTRKIHTTIMTPIMKTTFGLQRASNRKSQNTLVQLSHEV